MAEEDVPQRRSIALQDLVALPVAARPPAAGLPRLPVPRAGCSIHPAGPRAPTRRFQAAAGAALDRHATRLYYDGSSQGGIARRRAHRASRRTSTRSVARTCAGDELLACCCSAAIDFDHVRARSSTRAYPDELERPLDHLAAADPVGPRRAQRLRLAHDAATRTRTRRATRSCCTRPSATTRSPTSPRRSRRGRSARGVRTPVLDPGRSADAPAALRDPAGCGRATRAATRSLRAVGHRPAAPAGTSARPTPPVGRTCPPRAGVDPHDLVHRVRGARAPADRRVAVGIDGRFVDVCGDEPCRAAGWTAALPTGILTRERAPDRARSPPFHAK